MLMHNWELELELRLDVADESSGSGFFSGFLAQVFTWDCARDCASELALILVPGGVRNEFEEYVYCQYLQRRTSVLCNALARVLLGRVS